MAPSSAEEGGSSEIPAYRLPEHARIARLLRTLDSGFLTESSCWFGGGTAIVMKHGEYRMSLDVDFLCSSQDGYRALRQAVTARGSEGIFAQPVKQLRDFRCDQYGLRTAIEFEGHPVKFEIVREGRIEVSGAFDAVLGCPLLSPIDQFAEKLLANSDRCRDTSTCYRDALDLGILILGNGGTIPGPALAKAEAAYGVDIRRHTRWVVDHLAARPTELARAASILRMDPRLGRKAITAVARAFERGGPPPVGNGNEVPSRGHPSEGSAAASTGGRSDIPVSRKSAARRRDSDIER